MTKPVRLQLSRKAGFDLQETSRARNGLPAVVVSRPGRFGNPFKVGGTKLGGSIGFGCSLKITPFNAVHMFKNMLALEGRNYPPLEECVEALRGRNLACWCAPGAPCHADVLLAYVNNPPAAESTASEIARDPGEEFEGAPV